MTVPKPGRSDIGLVALAAAGLVAPGVAAAGPAGEPLPDPEVGILSVFVGGGSDTVRERDGECGDRRRCTADWDRSDYQVEIQLSPVRGLGVYGGYARRTEVVTESDYRGKGSVVSLGVRGALPVSDLLSIAANARLDVGANAGIDGVFGGTERSTYTIATASVFAVAGDPDRGMTLWAGPQVPWYWEHVLQPLGDSDGAIELPMQLGSPVSAVGGLSLTSANLGLPWRRGGRISFGVEGRGGAENGFSVWGGVHY